MKMSFEGVPYSRLGTSHKSKLRGTIRRKLVHRHYYEWEKGKRKQNINQYHAKNGHMNEVYLRRLAERDKLELVEELQFCDDCDKGKAKRRRVKKISSYIRAGKLFGRVYIDTTGPMKVRAKGGYRYAVIIVDDFSRKKFTYLIKKKSGEEILGVLKLFLNEHVLKSGNKLEIIRSDNGTEYKNREVIEFLADEKVMREYISDYVKQQNAVVETAIRDVKNLSVTLLNGANLRAKHESLWGEAMFYATDTLNWMPTSGNINFRSPIEMCKEKCRPLDVRYQWGSMAGVIVEDRGQMENREHECIFVGYEHNQPGYACRFMKLENNEIISSSNYQIYDGVMLFNPEKNYFDDTIFLDEKGVHSDLEEDSELEGSDGEASDGEVKSYSDKNSDDSSDEEDDDNSDKESEIDLWKKKRKEYLDSESEKSKSDKENNSIDNSNSKDGESDESKDGESDEEKEDDKFIEIGSIHDVEPRIGTAEWHEYNRKYNIQEGKRERKTNSKYGSYHTQDLFLRVFVCSDGKILVPKSYEEMLKSENLHEWKEAVKREYNCLMKNKTWVLVPRPENQPVVSCKWIFDIKRNVDGSIKKFKGRLVGRGFTQTKGVDYFETYSSVASMTSMKMVLSIANEKDWDIHQLDIETAYLNAEVKETIYMEQPQGFVEPGKEGYVCLLKKSLYGLKQSARNWNNCLGGFLKEIGLEQSKIDDCVYYYKDKKGSLVYVIVYVDDLIVTGNSNKIIVQIKDRLKKRFVVKDLGQVHQLLGMVVERDRKAKTMKIHQGPYIRRMLSEFDVTGVRPTSVPATRETYVEHIEAAFRGDKRTIDFDYRSAIGAIMHLSNSTRPDLTNITRFLASFVSNYTDVHIRMVKKVLKYLEGVPDLGLFYQSSSGETTMLSYVHKFSKDDMKGMLHAYSDASWGDNYHDATSNSGIAIMLGENLVLWKSLKQREIAMNSMHSEYIAMSKCVEEIKFCRELLLELGLFKGVSTMITPNREAKKMIEKGVIIRGDNISSIIVANGSASKRRTKGINIKYHNVKQAIIDQLVKLEYVKSSENRADMFTKCLGRPTFEYLRGKFMK
jgi:transposase InsO family protein